MLIYIFALVLITSKVVSKTNNEAYHTQDSLFDVKLTASVKYLWFIVRLRIYYVRVKIDYFSLHIWKILRIALI